MNIAVLGASGRTGRQVVARALAAGHQVTAVVRDPETFGRVQPQLRIAAADVLSAASLTEALRGADAEVVCSVLGSRTPSLPTTLYSASMSALIAAMRNTSIRRLVAVTAIPAQPRALTPWVEALVVHRLLAVFFGGAYQDMVRMEQVLSGSDTDWTVLRPPRLTDAAPKNRYRRALDARLPRAFSLPRADLALAMLEAIEDRSLVGHAVTVAA